MNDEAPNTAPRRRWHYAEQPDGTFHIQATQRRGQAGRYTDTEGDVYAAQAADVRAWLTGTPGGPVWTVDGDLLTWVAHRAAGLVGTARTEEAPE